MGRSQRAVITSKYITFLIFFCGIICKLKNDSYLCSALREKHLLNRSSGEVAEWSIAAVLKTVVLKGTRGSNPCLSAENKKIRL